MPIPVGDGASLLRRRPDVREAERVLAAATARIGVATADLYPTVTLGASIGIDGRDAGLLQPLTNRYGLGPLHQLATEPERGAGAHRRRGSGNARGAGAFRRCGARRLARNRNGTEQLCACARSRRQTHARARPGRGSLCGCHAAGGGGPYGQSPDAHQRTDSGQRRACSSLPARAEIANDQVALFLALGGGWERVPEAPLKSASRF